MEERFICPFCGRDDIYRKRNFTNHINHCKENPDRVEHCNKGQTSWMKGKTHSEETRKKISEATKKAMDNPEIKQKLIESHKGQQAWNKGKNFSDVSKQKMSDSQKKRFENPEERKRTSETTKAAMWRPDVRDKLLTNTKISHNTEHYKKTVSDSQKKRFENPEERKRTSETTKAAMWRPDVREKIESRYNDPEFKQKLSEIISSPDVQQKIYNTKKQNNSFNTSKIEEQLKEYFIINNINFKTQYKSDKYPFMCDFYFPDKDLYVEIQGCWTHGGKPFDANDIECIEQLALWKSKNKPFYLNAIDTWTNRDVRKRNYAKEHKLNWIEIFSDDFETCITEILKLL